MQIQKIKRKLLMDVVHHLFDDNIEFVDIHVCDTEGSLYDAIWNLFLQSIVHLIGQNNSFILSHVDEEVLSKVIVAFRKLHIEIQVTECDAAFKSVPGMIECDLSTHIKMIPSINRKIRFVFYHGPGNMRQYMRCGL